MKKNKNQKNRDQNKNHKPKSSAGVIFEMEEDAEQMFIESLKQITPEIIKNKSSEAQDRQEPRSKHAPALTIDLHGQTVNEAQEMIKTELQKKFFSQPIKELVVTMITGKGRHSGESGGVLFKEIYNFVESHYQKYIAAIDQRPEDTMIYGLPFKGFFNVRFKK